MLKTLRRRKTIATLILAVMISAAGYSAIPSQDNVVWHPSTESSSASGRIDSIFDTMLRVDTTHVIAHIVTFAVVAMLVGPLGLAEQRGNARLVLLYVIIGTVVWETVQATVFTVLTGLEATEFTLDWMLGVYVDFFVNIVTGIFMLMIMYSIQIVRKNQP